MKERFIKLNKENITSEHICCAISDKKHLAGVLAKKEWIKSQLDINYTFYKLNENGKIFIEYTDVENAWAPVNAPNYIYIHCLWVAGSFKGNGYAKELLNYAVDDAKKRNKSGLCIIAGNKKLPFLADKKFLEYSGFKTADTACDYELMALSFDNTKPEFFDSAKLNRIDKEGFAVYYSPQCPYILNCVKEINETAKAKNIKLETIAVNSKEQAQNMPCVFNNFVVFKDGVFITHQLLNAALLEKEIERA